MSITAQTVVTRARETLADEGLKFFISDDVLLTSAKDCYNEVYSLARPRVRSATITQEANVVYVDIRSKITDYLAPVAIWNPQKSIWLEPTSKQALDDTAMKWELTDGEPSMFFQKDWKYLCLHPTLSTVNSETLDIYYRPSAPDLTLGTSVDITGLNERILEEYIVGDGLEQFEEFEKARTHKDKYEIELDRLQHMVWNRESVDLTMRLREITPDRWTIGVT